jgi:UDP-glucuronate 4-epimerase
VVTGGAGFVGSVLVDRLLGDGWSVTVVDSFDGSYPAYRKHRNLASAKASPAFRLVEGDTREIATMAIIRSAEPDVVFDMAARAGVRPSLEDPQSYIETNVRGLQNTIGATAAAGAKLVFASSSSIYGNDPELPFREDQGASRPASPYGATKVAGEALVHAHHEVTGLPIAVARLFTVYGPRQRPDLAIHAFARNLLDGRPIDLYADGRNVRDYTYVDDAVDALVRLAQAPDPALLVNVGSHHPIETLEVVRHLEQALGVEARTRLMPRQPGDVTATFADITRARERLGWEPQVPFAEGIDRFCAWLLADGRDSQE